MTVRPYGSWPSPIDADVVTSASKGYGALCAYEDDLFWIESRPEEGGRGTLIRHAGGEDEELTPAPFNPRSGVHEYGGGAYCIGGDCAYFVNFADQDIYEVTLGHGRVRQVTRDKSRYADLVRAGNALLAVRETHAASTEPTNELVRIEIDTGRATVLHAGHDFYAAPRPSDDGRIAFLVWDHPNMPWDGTQLVVAEYANGQLRNETVVAGGATESVVQPLWQGERLLFASDANGYWNLHAYDASGVYCVLADRAEYAGPGWQFGASYFVAVGTNHVVARRLDNATPSLVVVDIDRGFASPLHDECCSYASLTRTPGGVAFLAGFPDQPGHVAELALDTRLTTVVAKPDPHSIASDVISGPEPISYASGDAEAHAYFYAPRNAALRGLSGELPPLLVTTHGGPTSSASANLSWRIQFYTSRGWAVADVNYSGSTGYGRAYRTRLDGNWGQLDIADCEACVRHLVAAGRVDPNRVAIRGGSAGGYTTLASLAFSDVFKAGASHYGIGDLTALDRDTHKFESRYLGKLVGDADAMRERSPINHVDRLNCPVIFFQGAEDRIVPPNQAEAMRDALVRKGLPVAYLLFEGEGHGFRRAENARRAIEAEYAFFARIFGIEAPGLPDLPITNLEPPAR